MEQLLLWLDFVGIVAFAMTGGLVAARKGLDVFGFVLLATVTGVGGGTLRDVVLDRTPVFWVQEPVYLSTCVLVALFMFFAAQRMDRFRVWIIWADAIGMALFAAVGTEIAYSAGANAIVSITLGVTTAVFGGIIRDVLAGEPSLVMRREVYATACALGAAVTFYGQAYLPEWSILLGIGAAFALRAAGIVWQLQLPGYNWKHEDKDKDAKTLEHRK